MSYHYPVKTGKFCRKKRLGDGLGTDIVCFCGAAVILFNR